MVVFAKYGTDGLQNSGLPENNEQKRFFMRLKAIGNEEIEEILRPFGYRNT